MNIAVVDDSKEDAQHLVAYLEKFQFENNITFQVRVFYASFDFLEEYHGEYDVIFLDIEMPGSDGLEVAREIRKKDTSVGIIFVTSLAQYAIDGYQVQAIDFMVKPLGYCNFSMKLQTAFRFIQNHKKQDVIINSKEGIIRLAVSDIIYIEKEGDFLVFYTVQGCYRERGSMKIVKEKLSKSPFAECISGCFIHLDFVKRIGRDSLILVSGKELPLSRRLKKEFTQRYIEFIGGL